MKINILNLIYHAIDELNMELDDSSKLKKSEDGEIYGTQSKLDSLGLINFITILEESIEENTGQFLSIADEKAMSLEESPFRTVGTLKNYIDSLLDKNE